MRNARQAHPGSLSRGYNTRRGFARHDGSAGSWHREGAALAVFVLVHPAWLGGWCWKKLVPLLEEHGHSVRTPTLTGLGERSHLAHPGIVMPAHIDDVASVPIYDDLREVILAGTSSSGAVISGVADRVPERISQLVYIDAFVPDDGQAVFDLISPQRRPAMEALVESEGFGWLLPRYAAQPGDRSRARPGRWPMRPT